MAGSHKRLVSVLEEAESIDCLRCCTRTVHRKSLLTGKLRESLYCHTAGTGERPDHIQDMQACSKERYCSLPASVLILR